LDGFDYIARSPLWEVFEEAYLGEEEDLARGDAIATAALKHRRRTGLTRMAAGAGAELPKPCRPVALHRPRARAALAADDRPGYAAEIDAAD
jgi:hypothetical protein